MQNRKKNCLCPTSLCESTVSFVKKILLAEICYCVPDECESLQHHWISLVRWCATLHGDNKNLHNSVIFLWTFLIDSGSQLRRRFRTGRKSSVFSARMAFWRAAAFEKRVIERPLSRTLSLCVPFTGWIGRQEKGEEGNSQFFVQKDHLECEEFKKKIVSLVTFTWETSHDYF